MMNNLDHIRDLIGEDKLEKAIHEMKPMMVNIIYLPPVILIRRIIFL